ncbi:pilus assembly protein [Bacillus timonensis]|nr:pilus assembly protein [Bacillus timonensis]
MMKDEKGQSMVEMALLLPVLLLLLVGIIDFGRVLYAYTHLQLATQETVRLGGLGKGDSEITQFAKDYVHLGNPDSLQVDISPTELNRNSGEYMTVQLDYPIELITPFMSTLFPSPLMISTESTIRVE